METEPGLPQTPRHNTVVKILVAIIALLLLAGGGYYLYTNSDQFVNRQDRINTGELNIEDGNNSSDDSTTASENIYYAVDSVQGSGDDHKFDIYKFNGELGITDTKLATGQNYPYFGGKYVQDDSYVYVAGNSIYVFQAKTGQIEKLLSFNDKATSRRVALSHDRSQLAYGINYEGPGPNFPNGDAGEIWLFDVKTNQSRKIAGMKQLGLYQGFSVEGWSSDDKQLVVTSRGGDAGAVWGDVYLVDVATGKFQVVSQPPEAKIGFVLGQLSPSGDQWLYHYCARPNDAVEGELSQQRPCPDGEEAIIYNFATQKNELVYRNRLFGDNVDANKLRIIPSAIWQDDEHVLVVVPSAVLRVELKTGKAEKIYTFDPYHPQNIFTHGFSLATAHGNLVVFQRYNGPDGTYVLNTATQKVVEIGSNQDRGRYVQVIY